MPARFPAKTTQAIAIKVRYSDWLEAAKHKKVRDPHAFASLRALLLEIFSFKMIVRIRA